MSTRARRSRALLVLATAVAALGVLATPAGALSPSAPIPTPIGGDRSVPRAAGVERWAGADRYATSAAISERSFHPGVSVAYVTSGLVFTDALSGAPVAARSGSPVLLVRPDAIPSAIATELERLRPSRIVVLGGSNSVSVEVERALTRFAGDGGVVRIDGVDRFDASAAISRSAFAPGVKVAFITSGRKFTDALSVAPVAGRGGNPVLLVEHESLPGVIATELRRLRAGRIVVLGGNGSVRDSVVDQLRQFTSGPVPRWAGSDRYETSAAISRASFAPGVRVAFIASGEVFSDALSGAPVAGVAGSPMLLVSPTRIPESIRTELARLRPQRIVVLGGTSTISAGVESDLAAYVS